MKRLSAYSKSKVLNIKVRYGSELVHFNLATELRITEEKLNTQLKTQPGYYGFCLLLHKKLLSIFETKKMERKSVYGRLFLNAKENKTMNGRPYSDDSAKVYVESHKQFIAATTECIKAKDDADQLYACIRAFEQRKDLMQSISSNIRNNY